MPTVSIKPLNYHSIIRKHISPESDLYGLYLIHVTLVTGFALEIGRRLGLTAVEMRFIEEAAMLHDIGIVKTNSPAIYCYGDAPYMSHTVRGSEILIEEGLPDHARVAENHLGLGGLSAAQIAEQGLPLPERDMLCEKETDWIISYADCFFSKSPAQAWEKRSAKEVRRRAERFPGQLAAFDRLYPKYGV